MCIGLSCTVAHESGQSERVQPIRPSARQRELLKNGVTFGEYDEAVHAYRTCLDENGYELSDFQLLDVELYWWLVPNEAVDSGVDDECYVTTLAAVDGEWQRNVYERHGYELSIDVGDGTITLSTAE